MFPITFLFPPVVNPGAEFPPFRTWRGARHADTAGGGLRIRPGAACAYRTGGGAVLSTDIGTCLTPGDGRSFDHGRCSPCSTECVPRRYRLVTWVLTLGCSRKRAHPRARLAATPGRGCPPA